MAESTSVLPNTEKPVIVRVKRKAFQSPLDAFWLEINERPLKRALHDFEKLSISNASSSRGPELYGQRPLLDFEKLSLSSASSDRVKEFRKKKILVQHVKTVASSKDTFDVIQTFMPNSSVKLNSKEKNEGRRSLKTMNKQDSLQVKARQRQEIFSRHSRFEQIWRSRKATDEAPEEEAINDMCKLYDVVRVDVVEEHTVEVQKEKDTDCKMMADFLPLLRDVLPNAAEEIESDVQNFMAKQASPDGFVYDFYAIKEDDNEMEADLTSEFPLIQVDDDDDFYDGPDDSEYETDDSNGENNPMNDYPDEEMSEYEGEEDEDEEDEVTSRSSEEELEGESRTSRSESEEEEMGSGSEVSYDYDEDSVVYEWSDNARRSFKGDAYSDGDDESYM